VGVACGIHGGKGRLQFPEVRGELEQMTDEELHAVRAESRKGIFEARVATKLDPTNSKAQDGKFGFNKYRLKVASTLLSARRKEEDIVIADKLKDVPVKEKMMSEYWTTEDQLNARWAWDKPMGRDRSLARKRGHDMFDKKWRHYRAPHYYTTPEYYHCEQRFRTPGGGKQLTEGSKIYTEWKDFYKEEDEKYFAQDKAEHDARLENKRTFFNTGSSLWRVVAGKGKTFDAKNPKWKYGETQQPLEPVDLTIREKHFKQIPRSFKVELPIVRPEEDESDMRHAVLRQKPPQWTKE
jgi:hypothetical protein